MTNLTGKNFKQEAEQAEQPVLIGFYHSRCAKNQSLESLEKDFPGRLKFCCVDVDREEGIAQQFDIFSVPTLVLLWEGEVLQRIWGEHSAEGLSEMLDLN